MLYARTHRRLAALVLMVAVGCNEGGVTTNGDATSGEQPCCEGRSLELKQLTDVDDALSPAAGDVLIHGGASFTARALTLADLGDVQDSLTPAQGDLLVYQGDAFVTRQLSLRALPEVSDSLTPAVGAQLVWDGSQFDAGFVDLDALPSVAVAAAQEDDVLTYQGGVWVAAPGPTTPEPRIHVLNLSETISQETTSYTLSTGLPAGLDDSWQAIAQGVVDGHPVSTNSTITSSSEVVIQVNTAGYTPPMGSATLSMKLTLFEHGVLQDVIAINETISSDEQTFVLSSSTYPQLTGMDPVTSMAFVQGSVDDHAVICNATINSATELTLIVDTGSYTLPMPSTVNLKLTLME